MFDMLLSLFVVVVFWRAYELPLRAAVSVRISAKAASQK